MLKLTDLTVSKELDRKAMSGVRGGNSLEAVMAGLPLDLSTRFDFMSGYQPSEAAAVTGAQSIEQNLIDTDVAVAGNGGSAFNHGSNSQTAYNVAGVNAISVPVSVKL